MLTDQQFYDSIQKLKAKFADVMETWEEKPKEKMKEENQKAIHQIEILFANGMLDRDEYLKAIESAKNKL
jgi:hypothetical protein